jgi:phosphoserine phosphatase
LGIDYVHASQIIDGKLTGKYLGDVLTVKESREYLKAIAERGLHINQTIVPWVMVLMVAYVETGLSAFHAKQR